MADLTGVLVEVTEAQDSSTLIADVSIGGLLLPLQNADDFPEPGLCSVAGASYLYNEVTDNDELVLDSSTPLLANLLADDENTVYALSDPGTEDVVRTVWVRVNGEPKPIPSSLPTGMRGYFRLGDADAGALVKIRSTASGYEVVSRPVDEDGLDLTSTYVPTVSAAKGTSQAIPHNTWTTLTGWFVTKRDRITADFFGGFTVERSGLYDVRFGVSFDTNTTGQRAIRMRYYLEDGTDIGPSRNIRVPSEGYVGIETNQIASLTVGMRVTFEVFQNGSGVGNTLDVLGSNVYTAPPETDCNIRWVSPR